MLNSEQTEILEQVIFLLFKLRNDQSIDNWERKRERELAKILRLKSKEAHEHKTQSFNLTDDEENKCILKFTEKEILQMHKKLRIVIRELGCAVYARKRTTGRYNCSYEIRFNRGGFKISASGRTREEAKQRFIEKSKLAEVQKEYATPTIPKTFDGFAMYWFENFHKRKVADRTYDHDIKLYNRHIKERFGSLALTVSGLSSAR